jgi:aspartyl-tRNA(Asn)/glutamyl-tRNA(Gln) amidotransferase subunit A
LSVCSGFAASGLPFSLQIVGKLFDEATVLRAGHAYEEATPWRDKRPVLQSG